MSLTEVEEEMRCKKLVWELCGLLFPDKNLNTFKVKFKVNKSQGVCTALKLMALVVIIEY